MTACHQLVVEYICLYELSLLYRLFIQCIIVVNFNVSSIKLMHMLNFLGTFSMGVTFGTIGFWVNVLIVVVS
jgi:hypothetical protein